jgi:hypothetical protein
MKQLLMMGLKDRDDQKNNAIVKTSMISLNKTSVGHWHRE